MIKPERKNRKNKKKKKNRKEQKLNIITSTSKRITVHRLTEAMIPEKRGKKRTGQDSKVLEVNL